MAPFMPSNAGRSGTRHRPGALSLDTFALSQSVHRPAASDTSDKRKTFAGTNATGKSFVKLRCSVNGPPLSGIPPDLHHMRYAPNEGEKEQQALLSPVPSPRTLAAPLLDRINSAGNLLERTTPGGASVALTLDRSIHYRASPSAVSAWGYHDYQITSSQRADEARRGTQASPPESRAEDPLADPSEVPAVPRVLLAFTLDVLPNLGDRALGIRENYEFIATEFDFWTASSVEPSKSSSIRFSYTRTDFGNRRSMHSCDMPVVRGFAAGDLPGSGFLQSFGPTLYRSVHDASVRPQPVVLGTDLEHYNYKTFERKMAKRQGPVKLGADKIAARGTDDGTSSMPATPLSAGFTGSSYPTTPTSTSFEVSAYGTSSIRVMLKRDTTQEAAWCARKIPFLILLEYPPSSPGIEAKLKLDTSTVRQNLPGTSRRNSLSVSGREKQAPGQARSSKNPPVSASAGLARRLSVAPSPANDEDEELVKIYPRTDAVSVVSCGLGTVKDTLYPTGLKARQANSVDSMAGNNLAVRPPQQHARSAPSLVQPSHPAPVASRPPLRHGRSQSAQFTPGMFKRTSSYAGSSTGDSVIVSSDTSSVRSGLQASLASDDAQAAAVTRRGEDRPVITNRRRESIATSRGVQQDSRERSMTASTSNSTGTSNSGSTSMTMASSISGTTAPSSAAPEEDLDDLFDMVLTTWTEQKMREYSPPDSIVYVNSPTMEKQFIPFANGKF